MSKTSKITKTNSVLLATVLVAGIIALSYPSFMVGAQAQEYGMDQRYNSYEPEYGQDNQYNSYEPQYGQDYGMNSYDKKPYGKDNSYEKSSVTVKNIKCKNVNVFLNGDISVNPVSDLSALAADAQGEDGANGGNFGNDRRGGDDRGHDSNSGFICKITNNNDGSPRATPEEPGEEPTDPDCDTGVACIFGNLNPTQLVYFLHCHRHYG